MIKKFEAKLHHFFFRPASSRPLGFLRIGLATILLLQAIMCAPEFFEWYGTEGFLQGTLMERLSWGNPQTTHLTRLFAKIGWSEHTTLSFWGGMYFVGLLGLLIGWHTKFFSILAWATHTLFGEAHASGYGLDLFANIGLFYLIWMPCDRALSLDVRQGKVPSGPSGLARLSLRVWQIHLCAVYFISGIEKAEGQQWRNGEAIWRSLMLPAYIQYDFSWLAQLPWLAIALCWGTLLIEIGYPFFIFPSKTRKLWVALTVSLHFGIALFLGLHLFACIMALYTFCAFGLPTTKSSRPTQI